jgi:hypothetical protein
MKRLSATEKGILSLAGLFIIVGAVTAIHPTEIFVWHPEVRSRGVRGPSPPPEHVTKDRARVYGVVSIALGVSLGGIVFYRPRS